MAEKQSKQSSKDDTILLCYDGSEGAKAATRYAAETLQSRTAIVLTVWEHFQAWEPYDPGALGTALVTKLGEESLGLDEIAQESANKTLQEGIKLAQEVGFTAAGRLEGGKPWRVITDVAEELKAGPIVIGARGLSRTASLLLGSVTLSVIHHCSQPVLVVHNV